jgi:hypothetical protein
MLSLFDDYFTEYNTPYDLDFELLVLQYSLAHTGPAFWRVHFEGLPAL